MRKCVRAAALLGALLLLGATPAGAQENLSPEGQCQEECTQARRVCYAAAHTALGVCHARCDRTLEVAIQHAQRVCVEQQLGPQACQRLIQAVTTTALASCRDDCRRVFSAAQRLCDHERRECRRACIGELDPACVMDCRDDAGMCREDLGMCLGGCRDQAQADIEACRDQVGDTCDLEVYRHCVREARAQGMQCTHDCYASHACRSDFGTCLRECAAE